AVVLRRVVDDVAAERRAAMIKDVLAAPVDLGGETIDISVSVGFAIFPEDTVNGIHLHDAARYALVDAKRAGPGGLCRFTTAIGKRIQDEQRFLSDIRRGLAEGEFVTFFQPKIDLGSGKVMGFEALCRWDHPTRGILPPAAFLSALDSPIVGAELSDVALKASFEAAHELRSLGLDFGHISINLNTQQLAKTNFEKTIDTLIAEFSVDPSQIVFEVVENVLIDDSTAVRSNLRALCHKDFVIALDDFGTGFASLNSIREPFIREIKIDRTFVMQSSSDPQNLQIVQAIVQMARKLNLTAVAEGIEDEETLSKLRGMGCATGQGFVFAPALPFEEAAEFIGRQSRIYALLESIED
ncbi:MAG: GGDEF domain-containing phosphodiesterase, partial [Pseudomonadota bacterium]